MECSLIKLLHIKVHLTNNVVRYLIQCAILLTKRLSQRNKMLMAEFQVEYFYYGFLEIIPYLHQSKSSI